MQYALGTDANTPPTEGWSTTIPTAVNAGPHYVWYKAAGDADHGDSTPVCVPVTISKGTGAAATAVSVNDVTEEDTSLIIGSTNGAYEYIVVPKGTELTDTHWSSSKSGNEGSLTFDNLTHDTEYNIYVRTRETANTLPGAAVETSVKTLGYHVTLSPIQPKVGTPLTATVTPAAPAGAVYEWYADNVKIDSATGSSYTPVLSDDGKIIKVIVKNDDMIIGEAVADEPVTEGENKTVSGVVHNESNTHLENVTVRLMQGDTVIATTTTDDNGRYHFTVPAGVYNIVATNGTVTTTELVELTESTVRNVLLPSGITNSQLTVAGSETPKVVVGGLDNEAASVRDETAAASHVTVTMTVEKKAENAAAPAEVTAIKNQAPGKTLDYLDIKIEKTVDTTTTRITEAANVLTIVVPYSFTGKRNVTVYRYHGTSAAALTNNTTKAEGTYTFDTAGGLIYIYTQRFSTYAIGYETDTGGLSGSGGSGSSGGSAAAITVPVSGDSGSVAVSASVSGTTATLKAIEQAVSDPDNDANALTLTLTDGSLTFDAAALNAIAEQAKGSDIRFHLDGISESSLKTAQRTSLQGMRVEAVYDAYMTSNNVRITDFKGGKAVVTVVYPLKDGQQPGGVVVWYVADDGARSEVPTASTGTEVTFTVEHFSNYVVVYDAERAASSAAEGYSGCPKDDTCPISDFTDAIPTEWYHDGVHYCLDESIMHGYGNGSFGPGDTTTRAMMAQIFYNMEGRPAAQTENSYSDVNSGAWYAGAVRWATQEGVMEGYGHGIFGPEDPVTREQVITIVYRYARYKGVSVSQSSDLAGYTDVDQVSAWAMDAVKWSVGAEAVLGRTDTTLNPKDTATRAEIATIIMRYCTSIA